ncbi:ADP-ribosylglycohydrolase family protein [Geomonas sp. Red32]|uniref:ADP-ribosylglycohydrolase family protein n=1 Tax=Geomonas sp. Red32 TaxID=2912856 RepID=UPI00202CB2BF|nr:ADP-ribosylglycohydrolase family protein [Geomonas sp. Red32]MCM0083069.1 ADP-ribosylglycohydrolase family protein [Geomonas sp. Red32]
MDVEKGMTATAFADRCRGAIWGQFIGDAACRATVKAFEEPAQGVKVDVRHPGELSPNGEAALLLLQSVAELGYFSAPDFGPRFVAYFSAEGYRGKLDQAARGTINNYLTFAAHRRSSSYHYQGGADDDGPSTLTRLAPVVVNRSLEGSLLKVVEIATRVCQDNQRAVAYAKCHALIMRDLLNGKEFGEAVKGAAKAVSGEGEVGREIAAAIEAVFSRLDRPVREMTAQFGTGSPLRQSFPAALHCALRNQNDFRMAIEETSQAGGDATARGAMAGAWLGALLGLQGIPAGWAGMIHGKDGIGSCIEKVIATAIKP